MLPRLDPYLGNAPSVLQNYNMVWNRIRNMVIISHRPNQLLKRPRSIRTRDLKHIYISTIPSTPPSPHSNTHTLCTTLYGSQCSSKCGLNSTSFIVAFTTSPPYIHLASAYVISIPAATPLLVHTFPSRVHRALGTHATFSPNCTIHAHPHLFVVARRPSNTPARASVRLPEHTLAT